MDDLAGLVTASEDFGGRSAYKCYRVSCDWGWYGKIGGWHWCGDDGERSDEDEGGSEELHDYGLSFGNFFKVNVLGLQIKMNRDRKDALTAGKPTIFKSIRGL